jgi:hydroxyacylglutathione hydrolase
MSRIQVHVVPLLSDNYGYLVEDTQTKEVVVVDPGEAKQLVAKVKELGLKPVAIWNTHAHSDHVDGNADVLKAFPGLPVIGSAGDVGLIPELTVTHKAGDTFEFGGSTVRVYEIPGHTNGHIAFYLPGHLFLGDLLFGYSCGNVMEGKLDVMYRSLAQLLDLPDETAVYCGHEYTLNNRKWAQTVEPDNEDIRQRVASETTAPTIPLNLGREKRTNAFLRCNVPAVQKFTGKTEPAEVFAELRTRKNKFS